MQEEVNQALLWANRYMLIGQKEKAARLLEIAEKLKPTKPAPKAKKK